MRLVISFLPDGTLETVLKDSAFDTRSVFGAEHRQIDRISEIIPTPDGMRFFIRWLRGPRAGLDSAEEYASYEAAVAAEVATINADRLFSGATFA